MLEVSFLYIDFLFVFGSDRISSVSKFTSFPIKLFMQEFYAVGFT